MENAETPEVKEEQSPSQKLKAENDALEAELIRAQRIRNEALMAATSGGRVEPVIKEETPKEYAARVMRGEI